MTPEEIAWTDDVRCRALKILTKCLRVKQVTAEGSDAHRIAQDAALLTMALCAEAGKRLGQAELADDEAGLQAVGYDLNALVSAAPSRIEE